MTPAKEFQQNRLGLVVGVMTLKRNVRAERLQKINSFITAPLSRLRLKVRLCEGLLRCANVKLDVQSRTQRLDKCGVFG